MRRALLLLVCLATSAVAAQVVLPTYYGGNANIMSSVANQLRCALIVMPATLVNATTLIFGVQTVGGTCAVGLYPHSDSGSILLSSNGVSCTTAGAKVGTSTAATLTAGTTYRLCMCSSSTATAVAAFNDAFSIGGRLIDVLNAGGTRTGTAANSCTAGALPPTTGALTAALFKIPVVVLE